MDTTLQALAKRIRYDILVSTTKAGSGHATSSLSATDLMTVLFFGGFFRADLDNPDNISNDRLIFSKGHASPLLYSLYAAAGKVSTDGLLTLRQFGSPLEGHPTLAFPYTEAATGSLGQGLSIGLGMALAAHQDKRDYRTFALLGDSEMAEGSVWEAIELAAHYKLSNLIGIIDCNGLGQRGEPMFDHDVQAYEQRVKAFGWQTIVIDGHDLDSIASAYRQAMDSSTAPVMIIAKTVKGKGISFLENKPGWHGKALSEEECQKALAELGDVDQNIVGKLARPASAGIKSDGVPTFGQVETTDYDATKPIATRKAYGNALVEIGKNNPQVVVLDAEVSNSTFADMFQKAYPERFFEMFIAEQNMVGTALGMSRRGKIPFVSTFAAFFSRAFDQIRMSAYSGSNIKFVGSHSGVSIGEDGTSQMGLEDIAMFRTILGSVVLYPSDAISTEKLVALAMQHQGNVYIRTTRKETPILYKPDTQFTIGGSFTIKSSDADRATVIGAGVTLHEALAAYEQLSKENVSIRVIDLYSIKPLDQAALTKAAAETKHIIVVEDHYAEGGIAEAVRTALNSTPVHSLAVTKMPKSGKPQELLDYEDISATAIVKKVKELL